MLVNVRTFHDNSLVVIHRRGGKFHFMEICPSFNFQFILLATKYLLVIVVESIEIRNLYGLIHISCRLLACIDGGELNVSVRLVGSIEGQRGIEDVELGVIAVVVPNDGCLLEMKRVRCRIRKDEGLDLK